MKYEEDNNMDWKRMKGLLAMGVGLLLCLLKGEVISIVLSIIGILVLVSAFFDWKNQRTNAGIVKLVFYFSAGYL